MAEGKGTPTPKQEKEPDKRPPWWKRLWEWTEFGKKSGWNWLELLSALAIPVVLAVAGLYFEAQLDERQRSIENQRAKVERELAQQRAQDEALQAYLSQMGSLLLEKDLRESAEDSEVRTLARARTLTVLGRMDPSRKTAVMQFLVEADLVQRVDGRDPIISLSGADLSNANLSVTDLRDADLFNAYLRNARLRNAGLEDAFLVDADLSNAYLVDAYLINADLVKANLRNANLRNARLRNANLIAAAHITNEELEQQAASLKGATMPNGQKYEDWLKSKDRKENE
jgi:uncharacterized protein YjbI with pentapeptide repeats